MSQSGDQTGDRPAAPGAVEREVSPRVVKRVEALLEAGRRQKAVRSPSLLESAQEALRDRMRSPVLRHAIAGQFSEPLRDLAMADSPSAARAAVTSLARMGATSGADTLEGMRATLEALAGARA